MAPLYKIKRAILEVTTHEASDIVVDKRKKQVFYNAGGDLKLAAEVLTKTNIRWTSDTNEAIKERAALLLANI